MTNDCRGHWQYPRDCDSVKMNCEYYAGWSTVGRGNEMRFKIQTTNTDTWTGIGFSNDEKMSQTDAIIGWVDKNGRPFLMDTWINGYSPPRLDDRQDIYNISGSIRDGVTILEFTRKRESNDESDLSFTDEHCLYLHFPVKGGAFNAVNKKIRKHETTPIVPDSRICIKSCGRDVDGFTDVPTTQAPLRLVYSVGVKLKNLGEGFNAPVSGTPEFDNLASTVSDNINGILSDIPGYYKTDVLGFEKDTNTMVAKMNLLFDKAAYEKGRSLKNEVDSNDEEMKEGKFVKKALLDRIVTGKVGSLTVDPSFLDFQALECKYFELNRSSSKFSYFYFRHNK